MSPKIALSVLFGFASLTGAEASECKNYLRKNSAGHIPRDVHLVLEPVSTHEAISMLGDDGMGSRPLTITRDVEEVWLVKVRKNVPDHAIRATYRFTHTGSSSDHMRHIDSPGDAFPARIHSLPVKTLCRQGSFKIVSGGFRLTGTAADISRAGSYVAELEVTLEIP